MATLTRPSIPITLPTEPPTSTRPPSPPISSSTATLSTRPPVSSTSSKSTTSSRTTRTTRSQPSSSANSTSRTATASSSSSNTSSIFSASSPTSTPSSTTTFSDPPLTGTLAGPSSDETGSTISRPAAHDKAATQNVVIAVLSAVALIALAVALFFPIRAYSRRQRRGAGLEGAMAPSMVHRHSSNGSRAALWAALQTGPNGVGVTGTTPGSDESNGLGLAGPVPLQTGSLRNGYRRHTSLLTDTPDVMPGEVAAWPYNFTMPVQHTQHPAMYGADMWRPPSPTAASSTDHSHGHSLGQAPAPWSVPVYATVLHPSHPQSPSRSPPPLLGTMVPFPVIGANPIPHPEQTTRATIAPPLFHLSSQAQRHRQREREQQQTHEPMPPPLDLGPPHEDAALRSAPPSSWYADHPRARPISVAPQTIDAWIAGKGDSSTSLTSRPGTGSNT